MTATAMRAGHSPQLASALRALAEEVRTAGSPVGAARAVRRIGARAPLSHQGARDAFRWEAEKLLRPFFGSDEKVAKAVAWLACDAAWEGHRDR